MRTRDGLRCVLCQRKRGLAAHHVARKSFLAVGRFAPGNGITLCPKCHKEPHEGFNARPDLTLPIGNCLPSDRRDHGAAAHRA